jgi:two-component system CheB/CheR fusion protein
MAVPENSIAETLSTLVKEKADENNISFDYHITGSRNKYAMIDSDHLSRILMNLLDNSIKFTPREGSVTFDLKVTYLADDQVRHTYTITDTGCGISEEFQERMYIPFEQENNSFTVSNTGTGLGLFICKSLVDILGGTIACQSQKNEGCTFTVTFVFNLATEEQIKKQSRSANDLESQILYGKNVMVVEDNSINAEVIMRMLQTRGMHAELAMDGVEATDLFKTGDTYRYQAIIMDIRMPVMDGIEATKRIRNMGRPDSRTIPIIGLSADSMHELVDSCMSAGMNALLPKPINTSVMFSTLSHELSELEKKTSHGEL